MTLFVSNNQMSYSSTSYIEAIAPPSALQATNSREATPPFFLLPNDKPHLTVQTSVRKTEEIVSAALPDFEPLNSVYEDDTRSQIEKYKSVLVEDENEEPRAFYIPEYRFCNFGSTDTENEKEQARQKEDQSHILKVHPLRFLRKSPFMNPINEKILEGMSKQERESSLETLKKQIQAIAVTESGEHVILQQAYASCVPTCVGMLLLDRRGTPNYETIQNTHYARVPDAVRWIEEAGFHPIVTELFPNTVMGEYRLKSRIKKLEELLQENGPGILMMGRSRHAIILDAIKGDTVCTRDPFHGWMVTTSLEDFEYTSAWAFIQILREEASEEDSDDEFFDESGVTFVANPLYQTQ